jgi:hypothetical protein
MQPTLPWILATLSATLFLVAAIVWRLDRRPSGQQKLPTEWALSARPVFSTEERRAYRQLREALPHHVVLSKLPLVRFCQPVDPQEVRYWYELLGGVHVTFAICSANGRVLAAIDLDNDRNPSRRSSQIKQAVLAACRVRYLRCPAEHLPSIPELQLLVPQAASAARGPQAAAAAAATWRLNDPAQLGRRREHTTLWRDSAYMQDSFFGMDRKPEAGGGGFGAPRASNRDLSAGLEDLGGVVIETPVAPEPKLAAAGRPTPGADLPTLDDPIANEEAVRALGPLTAPPSPLRH